MTVLNDMAIAEMLNELNPEQQEAAKTIYGPVLVIAGAGSGKCITGDSLVYTDKGILPISEIPNHYHVNSNDEAEAALVSYDTNGKRYLKNTSHWFNMGKNKTIKIITDSGYTVEGTPEHPLLVLNQDGNLEYKKLKDFDGTEYITLSKNNQHWTENQIINKDVAYLMGLLVADGRLVAEGNANSIYFCNSDEKIIHEYYNILENHFNVRNIKMYFHENGSTIDHYFSNKDVRDYLIKHGVTPVSAGQKEIPWSVLQSNKEIVVSFLQGLFDLESNVNESSIEITSASYKLLHQLQTVLLNFGIRTSLNEKSVKGYKQSYFRLFISGLGMRIFQEEIGYKNNQKCISDLEHACSKTVNTNKEVYPFQNEKLKYIRNHSFRGQSFWNGRESKLDGIGSIKDYFSGRRNPSANKMNQILSFVSDKNEYTTFLENISTNLMFEQVSVITESENVVYDFTVPETHSFVANGIVNHNTKSLTTRIANMLSQGVGPGSIFCATFTNKAAREMKERLGRVVGEEPMKHIWMGTFHSLCVRILRKHGHLLGYEQDEKSKRCKFVIYDTGDVLNVVERIYKVMNIGDKYKPGLALHYIDHAKNNLWDPEYCSYHVAESSSDQVMAQVYIRYQEQLKMMNAMDFGDLIMNTVILLRDFPEARDYWQQKFHFVMADEFQDANYSQLQLLLLLSAPHYNLFVVGDDAQSIYGFRGSDISIILNFQNMFPQGTIIKLEQNYRSVGNVVHAGNEIIKHNSNQMEKTLRASKDVGETIKVTGCGNEYQEAAYIAATIKKKVIQDGYKYEDFAILYRGNAQSRVIEDFFRNQFIAYTIVGGSGLR